MAATTITVQEIVGPFTAVTAGDLDITFAAMTITDGDEFQCTGKEIVVIRNDNGAAQTFAVSSEDDAYGRDGDITDYSLGAGEYAVLGVGLTNAAGWKDASSNILITPSSADLKIAVLRMP
jgi:hypothetical protein